MGEVKTETQFREQVTKFLATLPKTFVLSVQQLAIHGSPDLLICCRGRFFGCEIKTNEGEADPLQKHILDKITRAEGQSYLLRPKHFSNFKRDLIRLTRAKNL